MSRNNPDISKLKSLMASIVYIQSEIGVYHLNKLSYLFEFFFIKNFGCKYTKEYFIKLPHGPVISNYKKRITTLVKENILKADLNELGQVRKLTDDINFSKIELFPSDNIESNLIRENLAFSLLNKIVAQFGDLSVEELEEKVYQTTPLKRYKDAVENGFKKEIGGYILDNCIKLKDYKNSPEVSGRKLALKHIRKNPEINYELQRQHAQDLAWMSTLRPTFE